MRIKCLIVLQHFLIYLWTAKPNKHGFCSLKMVMSTWFYLLHNNNTGFWVHYLRSWYWRNNKVREMAGSFVVFHYHPLSVGKISTLISVYTQLDLKHKKGAHVYFVRWIKPLFVTLLWLKAVSQYIIARESIHLILLLRKHNKSGFFFSSWSTTPTLCSLV